MDDEKNAAGLLARVSELERTKRAQGALIKALAVMTRVLAEASTTDANASRSVFTQAERLIGPDAEPDTVDELKAVLLYTGLIVRP